MKITIEIPDDSLPSFETMLASRGNHVPHPVTGVLMWKPEHATIQQYFDAVAAEQAAQAMKTYPPVVTP